MKQFIVTIVFIGVLGLCTALPVPEPLPVALPAALPEPQFSRFIRDGFGGGFRVRGGGRFGGGHGFGGHGFGHDHGFGGHGFGHDQGFGGHGFGHGGDAPHAHISFGHGGLDFLVHDH